MKNLFDRINAQDPKKVQVPQNVQPGETDMGPLPEYLKRFWGLIEETANEAQHNVDRLGDEAQKLLDEHNASHHKDARCEGEECKKSMETVRAKVKELRQATALPKVLCDAFWSLARVEFGVLDRHVNVGLREKEGELVLVTLPDEQKEFADTIANALAGSLSKRLGTKVEVVDMRL